ncbi:MAG: DUF6081 family protein [Acidimicrobiia bacterium]
MSTARRASAGVAALAGAAVLVCAGIAPVGVAAAHKPPKSVVHYDFHTLAEYEALWSNPYGLGEMELKDTRKVSKHGAFSLSARPFRTASDVSVFDHLKYIAISNAEFAVPESGSLMFSVDIKADTSRTEPGRIIHGCYGESGSFPTIDSPCAQPWAEPALEGQQAGVVLNMVNFATGQLFDWFLTDDTAFALVERLPSNVTGFGDVGLDRAYTQIIKEVELKKSGEEHEVAIRYTRNATDSYVEYFLDDDLVARVDDVGVPLDEQGVDFTGIYPSLGAGEPLKDELDSFVIGHGLFSVIDAFPFQHPERPDLSVSIPISERIFGQGAKGTFSDFEVTTVG